MKNLSITIGLYIESAMVLAVLPTTLHQTQATLPVSRQVEASTWDEIDRTVSDPYYDIQQITIEQVEQLALMARTA